MTWLPDSWLVKARSGPRARWHLLELPHPERARPITGAAVHAQCGVQLDYDASTMALRLELTGINRPDAGERCPRCRWPS
jgi:hypothetical protein